MKRFIFPILITIFIITTNCSFTQDMSQEDMMKVWQEFMTPGNEHKMLEEMIGEWDGDITMWMDPSQPAQKYKGTATYTSIMGGRYIQGKYGGEMMGMPFEGMDINGYDKAKKMFFTFWIDNMGTGSMYLEGKYNPENKTIDFDGETVDPMGNKMKVREVVKMIDKDHSTFEMYMDQGQGEMKSMEIKYTRKK